MSSTTSVPDVLTALLGVVSAAVGPGVGVVDGQPLPNQYGDFVCVGWNGESPAVELAQNLTDMAGIGGQESYDVHSQVVSWQGSPAAAAAVRARVYGLLDAIVTGLVADVRLGGVCDLARLAGSDYLPAQTDKGAMATLTFTVHVQAMRRNT